MKRILLIALLLLVGVTVRAQYPTDTVIPYRATDTVAPYRHITTHIQPTDTVDVAKHTHKAFWRATAETVGMNLGLWAFDRYIQKGHFAYISWGTIKENFRHGFEWDNDHLSTNMFAHPYNGSIYFNAGRSNGFNFWQSELFAIGGSAMWEMFMECEYPSTNDIIATPIGGAAIGEVLYRTTDLIIDDRTGGGERLGREVAVFLLNPMRGFTRIVTGQAWRRSDTPGRRYGIPPISVETILGLRTLDIVNDGGPRKTGLAAGVYVEYGDRYADRTTAPYDYFSFLMELQAMDTQPLLSRAEIIGRLLSRRLVDSDKCKLSLGMYQHFDFFDSDTIESGNRTHVKPLQPCVVPYKLGTPASVGAGLMFRYAPTQRWALDSYMHVNGVVLAGILTDFYRDYHRNYNWGSGLSVKLGARWTTSNNRWSVSVANQFYRLYTFNGYDPNYDWTLTPDGKPVNVQGDSSAATFNHFEAAVKYRLHHHLYAVAGVDFYSRQTKYTDMVLHYGGSNPVSIGMPVISSKQLGLHLMLTYAF